MFLYPIRKRWRWLGSIGKTRHWLDFHVLVGITAPILITFHASFKLRGLAGMAYWIMIAVALSGFIGRYMYAQIPRSLNADQIAFGELEQQAANLALELERQELFRPEEIAPLLNVPSPKEIRAMPLVKVLSTLMRLDLSRPFLVSRLRRRVLSGSEIVDHAGRIPEVQSSGTGNRDRQRSPPVLAAHQDGVPRTHASGVSSLARGAPAVQLFFRRSGGGACHRRVDAGLLLRFLCLTPTLTYLLGALVVVVPMLLYLRSLKKREARAREAEEKGKLYSEGPKSQHPHIDTTYCIGCQSCTTVCPEGDVLAMLGGKAVIVNGYKCIGHSLCADACPVGAITMVMASPSMGADLPYLTPEYETSVPNLFIIGELGGLALIKNAVNQGRDCIDTITARVGCAENGRI